MNKQHCLNFLGIGAAFLPELKNTSAWFIKNGTFYLLDCGESVFEQLCKNRNFLNSNEIVVLLTHTHCDHCGSLGSLISYCNFVLNKKITIFSPTDRIKKFLNMVGINDQYYNFKNDIKDIDSICANFYEVQHAENMKCFGYQLIINSKNIYYSGDAKNIPQKVVNQFIKGEIEYIFHDTSLKENNHHCFINDILKIIPEDCRNRFYCMHLDSLKIDKIINAGLKIPTISI